MLGVVLTRERKVLAILSRGGGGGAKRHPLKWGGGGGCER